MTRLERAAAQMKGLRCSYPPYWVAEMADNGEEIVAMPGNTYEMLSKGLAPTAQQSRERLFKLRQKLNWSRSAMAGFIGVSSSVVTAWETGRRNPSAAAKKCLFLLDLLVNYPDQLKDAIDVMVWGRTKECLEFSSQLQQSIEQTQA